MNSKCYCAEILHRRLTPVKHEFRYQSSVFAFDLDELPQLSQQRLWFGVDRPATVSIVSTDYLDGEPGDLKAKLATVLKQRGYDGPLESVTLITAPRILGYAFNPVSFWVGHDRTGTLNFVLAEVNNTFGERHLYLLREGVQSGSGRSSEFSEDKSFYVSPFLEVEGEYQFRFSQSLENMGVTISLTRQGTQTFEAAMQGTALPFSWRGFLRSKPWTVFLTMPRIHWQAAILYFRKKVGLVPRPRPVHPDTVRAEAPTWLHRRAGEIVLGFLERAKMGELEWTLPNGKIHRFGDAQGPTARLKVWNWDFFLSVLWSGDVGFGDGYVDGDWESDDPTAVMRFFAANRDHLDDHKLWLGRRLGRLVGLIQEKMRANTLEGSRKNIQAHYDLSNDLYSNFLDPDMVYSCAVFESGDSLQQAQERKLAMLLDKASLKSGMSVLEIGSGWGALAVRAARRGCRVKGLTLSTEQMEWSKRVVAEAGLETQVEIALEDYRTVTGAYDRILSCEMLEAVGAENLGTYFAQVNRLLKPGGLAVIQVITFPEEHYAEYCRSQDWIQKRIFPGGHCPALSAVFKAVSAQQGLTVNGVEAIGPHYATTLREWRRRFEAQWETIKRESGGKFDERFRRMWRFYFCYCEAGFAEKYLDVHQIVLRKADR